MTTGNRRRVLMADDDNDLRTITAKFLRAEGLEVVAVENGIEALAQIERVRPDLVILDYMMPGKTGLEVLEEVRSRQDLIELPIILLTAVTHRHVRVGSLELGASDYLAKPFDPPELIARVRRLLRVLEAEDALRQERARQQQRLELLLEGAALLAGGASEDELYSELDRDLERLLQARLVAVFMREDVEKPMSQVFPQQDQMPTPEAARFVADFTARWERTTAEDELHPPAPLRPGQLWFPIRASGHLLGAVGYAPGGGHAAEALLDAGAWPTLSALSRLMGLAAENRALVKRELVRLAQETEMQSAIYAQERVLPDRLPVLEQLDTAAVTLPARATGGDYFCFFRYRDGTHGAFLADVVGKGLTAAMYTMVINTLVREHGPLSDGPRELLESLNRVLHSSLEWQREDPIPCSALRLGSSGSPVEIEAANSGHEAPLLVPAAGPACFLRPARSFPLGWKTQPAVATMRVQLDPGDVLLFYSDGLLELASREDHRGARPDAEALAAWFELDEAPLAALAVRKVVQKVLTGRALPDDVTVLMIRGGSVLTSDGIHVAGDSEQMEIYSRSSPNTLRLVRDAASAFLTRLEISPGDVFSILAALTEIHTNAILHGLKGMHDQPIRVGLRRLEDGVAIEVEEFHCGSLRPLSLPRYPYIRGDGGMGLVLTRKIMDELEYIRTDRISLRARMVWRPGRSMDGARTTT